MYQLRRLQGDVMYATYEVLMTIEGLEEGLDAHDIDMVLYKNLRRSEITVNVIESKEEDR
jgi:predicted methyltransferase MtxX (methanogen marker protein 4)